MSRTPTSTGGFRPTACSANVAVAAVATVMLLEVVAVVVSVVVVQLTHESSS